MLIQQNKFCRISDRSEAAHLNWTFTGRAPSERSSVLRIGRISRLLFARRQRCSIDKIWQPKVATLSQTGLRVFTAVFLSIAASADGIKYTTTAARQLPAQPHKQATLRPSPANRSCARSVRSRQSANVSLSTKTKISKDHLYILYFAISAAQQHDSGVTRNSGDPCRACTNIQI